MHLSFTWCGLLILCFEAFSPFVVLLTQIYPGIGGDIPGAGRFFRRRNAGALADSDTPFASHCSDLADDGQPGGGVLKEVDGRWKQEVLWFLYHSRPALLGSARPAAPGEWRTEHSSMGTSLPSDRGPPKRAMIRPFLPTTWEPTAGYGCVRVGNDSCPEQPGVKVARGWGLPPILSLSCI